MLIDIKAIVFDLDGTLIDSSKGILESLFNAIHYYGLKPVITKVDSHFFMGKNLEETLAILVPGSEKDIIKKIGDRYINDYHNNYTHKAQTFEGVAQTIQALSQKGFKMAVATAKYTECAEAELKSSGIRKFFDDVRGSDEGSPAKPDPKLLFEICNKLGVAPSETLMVGDTDRDVVFGKNAGAHTCAVTYGGLSKEEFIKRNILPDFFIDNFSSLIDLV